MASRRLYRIKFRSEEKIFELYAHKVGQGELFGFIEISDLAWGKKSSVIIDPTEQDLRNEFNGVTRFQVPMHAIIRIDEVEKPGTPKIIPMKGTKPTEPTPIYTPAPKDK